jgi:hypothetical protein
MLKFMRIIAATSFLVAQVPAVASDGVGAGMRRDTDTFQPIGERIGIAVHHPLVDDWPRIRALGLRLVRMDLTWQGTETSAGSYNFSPYLRIAETVHRAGLRPMFVLAYGNSLYSPLETVQRYSKRFVVAAAPAIPTAVEAYGRWAQAATTAFAPYDPIYEIWNEPDVDHFWPPAPDPLAYGTLAASACRFIRAANPRAEVIGPGVGGLPKQAGPNEYLVRALTNPGMSCLDEISVHTYQNPGHVGSDLHNWHLLRSIVDAHLPGKQLAVTEWGLPTSHNGDEQAQASYLIRTLVLALSQGVRTLIWYEYKDDVTGFKNDQDHYGLVHADNTLKPAAVAMKYFLNSVGSLTFACGTVKNNTFIAEFRDRSNKVAAIIFWNESGAPSIADASSGAIFTDSLGKRAQSLTFTAANADNPVYMIPAGGSYLRSVCAAK